MAAPTVKALRRAIVAVLDTAVAITSLTGRPRTNVVPWSALADVQLPVIAYHIVGWRKIAGLGDVRMQQVQFTAVAPNEELADDLIEAIQSTFTAAALAALTPPIGAYVVATSGEPLGFDRDADSARSDLTLTLHATA